MKTAIERFLTTIGALLLAMAFGAALTSVPTVTRAQADEPPMDCKKKPDDPRCKEERKYWI
jgi:hypothetical protein